MNYVVPPGLEYLTQLDQVLVQQLYEVFECESFQDMFSEGLI